MNRNEDAVSPVIGVILMVAITVILAAVIAAFVFGMGPSEMAPQSSLRASATDTATDDISIVMIEHQGGDEIVLSSTNTKFLVGGEEVVYTANVDDTFTAGERLYIAMNATDYQLANSTADGDFEATLEDIGSTGDIVEISIIDVSSQQMIASLDVRY
ncbi:type IV pilin [Methanococcoides methylutens]|nr:type IV pilin N-terminal domain-containing protein [Methanococcoides methylutens]